MSVYNLIETSDNCSKTSTSLWQNYRDDLNDNMTPSESFKYKSKRLGKTSTAGTTEDVEIAVPLKYLLLINCEIYLILTRSESCVISSATRATKFEITDTKLYGPVVTLSTQDNAKLLQQLRSGFKRIIIGTNINQNF